MSKNVIFLLATILFLGCTKDDPPIDPCIQLVNGIYLYPTEPPDSNLSNDDIWEYWNIPEDVLPCLNTDGLLESSLNWKSLSLYLFGVTSSYQSSYIWVKEHCRGFQELENRPDALDTIIARYKATTPIIYDTLNNLFDYGSYDYYTYSLELILGHEVYIKNASKNQKIELLKEVIVKQNFRDHRESWAFFEGPAFVMGMMMYYADYQPFLDEYAINLSIETMITYGHLDDNESKLILISLGKDYLNLLENN